MKKKENDRAREKDKNEDKKDLIEAQLKSEMGDENRTAPSYDQGKIEVTSLSDPPVRRTVRSMPRTTKAVTDALLKKKSKKKTGNTTGNKKP